jgi:hypothetical protein
MDALLIKVKFLDEYPTTGDYDAIRSKNLSQPDKVINVSGPWYLQAEPSGATTNRLILRK